MKDKKLLILIVLGIAAIISLIYGITSQKKTEQPSAKTAKVSAKKRKKPEGKIVPKKRQMATTEHATWAKSPFVQKSVQGMAAGLSLQGIIWDEKNPKAMINGVIVKKGDTIQGNTVVEIRKQSVVLNDGERDFLIKLGN